MKRWKVGLIGAGFWSANHLKAWSRIPNVEIVALCDKDRSKLVDKAEVFGVPQGRLYATLEEMLADCELDIVDIVTGPDTHLALAAAAALAGKHIMCQKPFARTFEEAESMVSTAVKCGVRLMVTENWRWLQPFQLIKRTLDSGELGRVRAARYIHTDYYTPRMAPGVALPQPFLCGMEKLLFFEMGPHWLDTWRFLFGMPERLYAEATRISPHVAGEDAGVVVMRGSERYGSDFYGIMDMSWATRQKLDRPLGGSVGPVHLEQLNIDGEAGSLKLYTSGRITIVDRDGKEERTLAESTRLDHDESHCRLQAHFIECLEQGKPFDTEGTDNLETLRLLFGIYESAATHLPVRFNT